MYAPVPPAVGGGDYGQCERSESMTAKENAHSTAATVEQAGAETAAGQAAISMFYYSMGTVSGQPWEVVL